MEFTPEYFIEKFEAIPESEWTCYSFRDSKGKFCVLGHCGIRKTSKKHTAESKALCELFYRYLNKCPVIMNDSGYNPMGPKSPKIRILNALKEIKLLTDKWKSKK